MSIDVTSSVLLVHLRTKVEVVLHLRCQESQDGLEVAIEPQASVVYGEPFNAGKMADFLATRIGSRVVAESGEPTGSWGDALEELQAKLLARGRK